MVPRMLALAAGVGLGVLTVVVTSDAPGFSFARLTTAGIPLLLAAGWAPMLAAVMLPRRRAWVAALLFLVGTATFVAEWDTPGAPALVFTIGLVAYAVAPAIVAHAVTVYGGPTAVSRSVAITGYLVLLGVLGFATSLWFQPDPAVCGCPGNSIAVRDDAEWYATANRWGVWAGLAWAVAATALVGWRLVSASAARLRTTGAVTACGFVYLGLTVAYYTRSLENGFLGSTTVDRQLWVAQCWVLVALGVAVVTELVRVRRAHRELAGVVTRMSGPDDLRVDLETRLRDPGLRIAYPIERGERLVDQDGQPVDLAGLGTDEWSPVTRDGVRLAVLIHRPGLDTREIDSLVSGVHLALEHERLRIEALAQLDDLRASAVRIVAAGDAERRRLERNLHDGAQQHLVSLALHTQLLRTRDPADTTLASAASSLQAATDQLRDTARRLSSVLLDSAGLAPALDALAETRTLTMTAVPEQRLPAVVESTVYLLAERASRSNAVSMSVTASDKAAAVELHIDGDPGLGDVVDRVTTLDGTAVRRRNGTGAVWEVTVPLGH